MISVNLFNQSDQSPVPKPRYAMIKNDRTLTTQIELIFTDFISPASN